MKRSRTVQSALRWMALCVLSLVLAFAHLSIPTVVAQEQPISDPIPARISKSGLRVKLIEFITVPASRATEPKARISFTTHANDNSGRIFTNDLRGKLYVVKNGNISVYLDLAAKMPDFVDTPDLGTGFHFFAFHPQFASNGKFYTVHNEAGAALTDKTPDYQHPLEVTSHSVVTEWTTSNPAADSFSGTSRPILRIGFRAFKHNIQQISFNPNAKSGDADFGLLYIAMGDGEEASTWTDVPQNLTLPFGKILRINPSGNNSPNGNYGIPADNPFVGQSGKLGEIWAYGFRNPHRFSWDSGGTHRMLIINIGEKSIEEINEGKAGANYGWNLREGPFLFNKNDPVNIYPLPTNDAALGYTYPVAMYDRDEGRAIISGFVYRGAAIPELQGQFIFGDIVSGRLFHAAESAMSSSNPATIYELTLFDANNKETTFLALSGSPTRADLRFGIDADGELFLSSKSNGKIWRMVRAAGSAVTGTPTPVPTGTPTPPTTPSLTPSVTATTTGTSATATSSATATITPSQGATTTTPTPTVTTTLSSTPTATVTGTVMGTATQTLVSTPIATAALFLPMVNR